MESISKRFFVLQDDIGLRNLQWLFAVPYWYIFGTTLPVANIAGNDRPPGFKYIGSCKMKGIYLLDYFNSCCGWNFLCICIDSRFFLLWWPRFSHIREAFQIEGFSRYSQIERSLDHFQTEEYFIYKFPDSYPFWYVFD